MDNSYGGHRSPLFENQYAGPGVGLVGGDGGGGGTRQAASSRGHGAPPVRPYIVDHDVQVRNVL